MNLQQFTQYYRQSLIEMIYESISQKQKNFTEILKCAEQIYKKSQKPFVDADLEDLLNRLKIMLQFSCQDISSHIDLALQQIQIAKRINLKIAPKTISEYSEIEEQEKQMQIDENVLQNIRKMSVQPKVNPTRINKDTKQGKEKSTSAERTSMNREGRSLSPKKVNKTQQNASNERVKKTESLQKKNMNQKSKEKSIISDESSSSDESSEEQKHDAEKMNVESQSDDDSLSKDSSLSSDSSMSEESSFNVEANKKQPKNNLKENVVKKDKKPAQKKVFSEDADENDQSSNLSIKDQFKKFLSDLEQLEQTYNVIVPKLFRNYDFFVRRKNREQGHMQELDKADRKFIYDLYQKNIETLTQRRIGQLLAVDPRHVSRVIIQHKQDEGMPVIKLGRKSNKSEKAEKKGSKFRVDDSDDDEDDESESNSSKDQLNSKSKPQSQTKFNTKHEGNSESEQKHEQKSATQLLNNDKINVKMEDYQVLNESNKPLTETIGQTPQQQDQAVKKKKPLPAKNLIQKTQPKTPVNKPAQRVWTHQKVGDKPNMNPNKSLTKNVDQKKTTEGLNKSHNSSQLKK